MFKTTFYTFFSTLTVLTVILAATLPGLADARGLGGLRDNRRDNNWEELRELRAEIEARTAVSNEYGVKVFDNQRDHNNLTSHRNSAHAMFTKMFFYSGEVISVGENNFVIETHTGAMFTVEAADAKIIRLPWEEIAMSEIQVGDKVHINGTLSGAVVTAAVIYDLSANRKLAMAKGTVTATDDQTLVVQTTRAEQPLTVEVSSNTQVDAKHNSDVTLADVESGSKVKIFGLWDELLNIFTAVKIKIL